MPQNEKSSDKVEGDSSKNTTNSNNNANSIKTWKGFAGMSEVELKKATEMMGTHLHSQVAFESKGNPRSYARGIAKMQRELQELSDRFNAGEKVTEIFDLKKSVSPIQPGETKAQFLLRTIQDTDTMVQVTTTVELLATQIGDGTVPLQEALDANAPDGIISVMKKWQALAMRKNDPKGQVQFYCFSLLLTLAGHLCSRNPSRGDGSTNPSRGDSGAVLKAGAVPVISSAIKEYPVLQIYRGGLNALSLLCADDESRVCFVRECEGIQLVLNAMNSQKQDETIIHKATLLLAVLSATPANRPALSENRHVSVLVQVMALRYPDHEHILTSASMFMKNMLEAEEV